MYMINKQLFINLKHCCNLPNLSILKNVYSVNLSFCNELKDVSMLDNSIHTLDLRHCKNLVDVSMLGKINTLKLADCHSIIDFSKLNNNKILDLSRTKITDVSNLKNVKMLNLSGCIHITDISELKNVSYLNINHCNNIKTDLSKFTGKYVFEQFDYPFFDELYEWLYDNEHHYDDYEDPDADEIWYSYDVNRYS